MARKLGIHGIKNARPATIEPNWLGQPDANAIDVARPAVKH